MWMQKIKSQKKMKKKTITKTKKKTKNITNIKKEKEKEISRKSYVLTLKERILTSRILLHAVFYFIKQIWGHHAIALLCINFSSMPYFCHAVIIYTCTTMGVDKSNLLLILNRLSIINTKNTNYWTYFTLLHTK